MRRETKYDHRGCTSLFGYSAAVHARSGGICQLCGAGGEAPNFDLWRQMTVEHLLGASQGGYPNKISESVAARFPELPPEERATLVKRIDNANTITACTFCNSTTSRDQSDISMTDLILAPTSGPDETYAAIQAHCTAVLERKRLDVAWKLESVRSAFELEVLPGLLESRGRTQEAITSEDSNFKRGRDFQEMVSASLSSQLGEPFDLEVELPIGTPAKLHHFDLASRSRNLVCECKAYGWTVSDNVPSAKITHLREAIGYLDQLPEATIRVLAVKRANHPSKSETLGEYFVRLNDTILGTTVVLELDESGAARVLWGSLDSNGAQKGSATSTTTADGA